MAVPEQHIKLIQEKLQQLLKRYTALQKENEGLKQQLAAANKHASSTKDSIEQLQQQVDILRLNSLGMNDDEKKKFEKKINAYVKEIDRCITLLKE